LCRKIIVNLTLVRIKKMKFIPFDKFTLETKKEKSELTDILLNQIEHKKHFRIKQYFSNDELKPFEGKIDNNAFKINRIIKYQNPFLPIIIGKFKTLNNGGSKIEIFMRVRYSILFFFVCWCLAPLLFFLLFTHSVSEKEIYLKILVVLSVILIGNGLVYIGFNNERNKAKIFLRKLFKTE